MTIAAGTRLGPYEILAPVGAGGMGEVYSARDTRLERSVAIKVLPAELSASAELKLRFEREARVVSGLNHPHICALYDVGQENGTDFLVMELCDGQSLADRLEKGPLPASDVLRYAIQIAGALDRAHRSGVTHRDLKPGNIMLTKSGAKLLDFGLARHQGSGLGAQGSVVETQQKPITEQGTILGTFQYMAPEQLEGAEADARSDIFAFGSVLYEMITGKRAFEGATRASLIASILDREPRPISELQPLTPPALERVVRTCLNKDPDERWQNAHDLMRELEWIRDGISSPSALPAGRRGTARAWLPWTVAAVLAVVAAGAIWTAARQFARREASLVSAIAPPADGQFIVTGDAAGPVTLSPDGRWAAYVAFNGNTTHLWVQSLESGNSQPLGGTERAMFPFWRPDSRSLGFFATGKLKIIDVDGLGLRVLADAADARGGTWGAGGDILFTPQTQGPIFRIAANGGTAAAVTVLETPITTHRWPEFLPDGRRFVFLAANHGDPTGAETAIFLGSVDGDPPRKVLPATTHAVVHGDHLLYVQSSMLLAQRLGEGGLEGEPIRIRDNVLTDPGTWRSIFSVSKTGLLAYHPGGEALGSRLVWVSRDGKELGDAPPRPLRDVSVSPRGDLLALTVGDPKSVLFIQDIERGVETRFSFVDSPVLAPIWTRDGRNILFTGISAEHIRIYIKPTDGSQSERILYESKNDARATDVSPDGSLILFNGFAGATGAIMAMPFEGGKPTVVIDTEGEDYDGTLSPDGRWIAYVVADRAGRAAYLAPFPGPGAKWQISNDVVYAVWWNRNGREILYLTSSHLVAVDVSFEGGSVRLGAAKRLFPLSINTNNYGISMTPDGERFVVVTPARATGVATLVTNWDAALQ